MDRQQWIPWGAQSEVPIWPQTTMKNIKIPKLLCWKRRPHTADTAGGRSGGEWRGALEIGLPIFLFIFFVPKWFLSWLKYYLCI